MLGIEVRTAAATALAARSCAATPRQSAAPASCFSIFNTRIWSAVGFGDVRVSARAAAHSHMCTSHTVTHSFSDIRVCVCGLVDGSLYCKAAPRLSTLTTLQLRRPAHRPSWPPGLFLGAPGLHPRRRQSRQSWEKMPCSSLKFFSFFLMEL